MIVANGRVDWSAVTDWFGYKTRFHDAEVVSIELNRWPKASIIKVHAFRPTTDTDAHGHSLLGQ